jgi:hypothetical protein
LFYAFGLFVQSSFPSSFTDISSFSISFYCFGVFVSTLLFCSDVFFPPTSLDLLFRFLPSSFSSALEKPGHGDPLEQLAKAQGHFSTN